MSIQVKRNPPNPKTNFAATSIKFPIPTRTQKGVSEYFHSETPLSVNRKNPKINNRITST